MLEGYLEDGFGILDGCIILSSAPIQMIIVLALFNFFNKLGSLPRTRGTRKAIYQEIAAKEKRLSPA